MSAQQGFRVDEAVFNATIKGSAPYLSDVWLQPSNVGDIDGD